jgi:hypothetical protein
MQVTSLRVFVNRLSEARARLHLNLELPWDVALQILGIVRGAEAMISEQRDGALNGAWPERLPR